MQTCEKVCGHRFNSMNQMNMLQMLDEDGRETPGSVNIRASALPMRRTLMCLLMSKEEMNQNVIQRKTQETLSAPQAVQRYFLPHTTHDDIASPFTYNLHHKRDKMKTSCT